MSSTDYYEILDLKKPSNLNEIRKAYHKMALKFHPDKNRSPEAAEIFKKINEAYDVLSTPEKKDIYDRLGKEGLNQNNIRFDEGNIFNIFNNVFAGQFPFGGGGGSHFPFGGGPQFPFQFQSNVTPTYLEIIEEMKLSELFTVKQVSKVIERNVVCDQCHGTGSNDGQTRPCKICGGRKVIQQQRQMGPMITIQQLPCPQCHGVGTDNTGHFCPKCSGTKTTKEKQTIQYQIPIGQTENDAIIIRHQGHMGGDVVVKINILPDDIFLRHVVINGKQISEVDLVTQIKLTLAESLCGFERIIKHVNGQEITLRISEPIKDGDIYVVAGAGLPRKQAGECGQLYVLFNVNINIELSSSKKMVLWELLSDTPYVERNYVADPLVTKLK